MAWNEGLQGITLDIAASNITPMSVIAGPGTGKTFTQMKRIARLIEVGDLRGRIDPSKILLVTFTRTAAQDLIDNLGKYVGAENAHRVKATTLHSLCYSILMRSNVLEITNRVPRPLMKFEEKFLIQDLNNKGAGNITKIKEMIRAFEAAWAKMQEDEPGWPVDANEKAFQRLLIHWLQYHNALLIGELVPLTRAYLYNNPACPERGVFNSVFIDEYQDLNKAEQQLIELLCDNATIMVVGDEDQSIYETMRYAHPEGIIDYNRNRPENERSMIICRRCPNKIVDYANNLISNNIIRATKDRLLPFDGNPDGDVHVVQWRSMEREAEGIAQFIEYSVNMERVLRGQIIILCPSRKIGFLLKEQLTALGVSAKSYFTEEVLDGDPKDISSNDAQKSFVLLSLLARPTDLVSLRCWLGFDYSDLGAGAYNRLLSYCETSGIYPYVALEGMIGGEDIKLPHTKKIVDRYADLKQKLNDLSALQGFNLIERLFPEDREWAKPIRELLAEVPPEAAPGLILDELITRVVQPELPMHVDFVRIMSLHKSKGLTADMVIICGCVHGLIPRLNRKLQAAQLMRYNEEQRRLFYVGITRTCRSLVLSGFSNVRLDFANRNNIQIGRVVDDDHGSTIASPYLGELGRALPTPILGDLWDYKR